jgi:chitin disaccharide deacetylase
MELAVRHTGCFLSHVRVSGSLNVAPLRFALCADDYAMTPAVTRGIVEALDAGALSATSVMTTSRWWPGSVETLKRYRTRADIGLHLNLTMDRPLGPMPKLAPEGVLPPIGTYLRGKGNGLPLDELDAEIGRQIDAFIELFGTAPDHIDGHQHVQALPAIRRLILKNLDRRRLAGQLWLRDSTDQLVRILARGTTLKKALGLAWLGRGSAGDMHHHGYATNEGFAGFSDFQAGGDYGATFARYLVRPGCRHLVMCHPGHVDDELRRLDPVVETREQELAFLLSPDFRTLLARKGAELVRLSTLVRTAR